MAPQNRGKHKKKKTRKRRVDPHALMAAATEAELPKSAIVEKFEPVSATAVRPSQSVAGDILVVIATEDEYAYVRDLVPAGLNGKTSELTGHCEFRYSYDAVDGTTYRIQMLVLGEQGELLASSVLMNALRDRAEPPLAVVSIGISMSLHDDVLLGDVVFASAIKRYLERAKVKDRTIREGGSPAVYYDLHFAGVRELALAKIIGTLKFFALQEQYQSPHERWQQSCARDSREYLKDPLTDHVVKVEPRLREPPKLHVGAALSGPLLVDSKIFKDKLLNDVGRIGLVLDMESGGLVSCSQWVGSHCQPRVTLVIRGASDYGDGTKKTYEDNLRSKGFQVPSGAFPRAAMRNAYRALLMLCDSGWIIERQ